MKLCSIFLKKIGKTVFSETAQHYFLECKKGEKNMITIKAIIIIVYIIINNCRKTLLEVHIEV